MNGDRMVARYHKRVLTVIVEKQPLQLPHLHQARRNGSTKSIEIEVQKSQRAVVLLRKVIRDRAAQQVLAQVQHVRILQLHALRNLSRQLTIVHAEEAPVVRPVRSNAWRQRSRESVLAKIDLLCEVKVVDGARDGSGQFVVVEVEVPGRVQVERCQSESRADKGVGLPTADHSPELRQSVNALCNGPLDLVLA